MIFKIKQNDYVNQYVHVDNIVGVKVSHNPDMSLKGIVIYTNSPSPFMIQVDIKEQKHCVEFLKAYEEYLESDKLKKEAQERKGLLQDKQLNDEIYAEGINKCNERIVALETLTKELDGIVSQKEEALVKLSKQCNDLLKKKGKAAITTVDESTPTPTTEETSQPTNEEIIDTEAK